MIRVRLILILVMAAWPRCFEMKNISWNGCIEYSDLEGTDYCYRISDAMKGRDAWKYCSTFNFSDSTISEAVKNILKKPGSDEIQPVWAGYRQSSLLSTRDYMGHEDTYELDYTILRSSSSELCLVAFSCAKKPIEGKSCNDMLPTVCKQRKFRAVAYEASSADACNAKEAVALSSFSGCFVPAVASTNCSGFKVLLRPVSPADRISAIKLGMGMEVEILLYKTNISTYQKLNSSLVNATMFCHSPSHHSLRLELRKNKTAGNFSLWLQHPTRAKWPPMCVGAEVNGSISNPTDIRVIPNSKEEDAHSTRIWCFVQDIVSGEFLSSNSVPAVSNDETECRSDDESKGPPTGTEVDQDASCLRCLGIGMTNCKEEFCETPCSKEGCGPFHLTLAQWPLLRRSTDDFQNCSKDFLCASEKVLKLQETIGDCNRDGDVNCDDLFDELARSCSYFTDSTKPYPYLERERYWNCRYGDESEFVDIEEGNKSVRYYCQDKKDGRLWSPPVYFNYLTPYIKLNFTKHSITTKMPEEATTQEVTTEEVTTTMPEEVTLVTSRYQQESEAEVVNILKVLERINTTLEVQETAEFVHNISKILQATKETLINAQEKTNIASIPNAVENAMLYVPSGTNITLKNVALSKTSSKGTMLVSEKQAGGRDSEFGNSAMQFAVNSTEVLAEHGDQIETAIFIPEFPFGPSIEFVVMIIADGSDILETQRDQRNILPKNETIGVDHNGSIPAISIPPRPSVSGSEVNSGCLNSPVIAANLVNGSNIMQLPENNTVQIFFKSRAPLLHGQQKHCVYYNPTDDGSASWRSDGCELVSSEVDLGMDECRCNHLTHFAQFVTEAPRLAGEHADHLQRFTIVSTGVSLLGALGVLLTGVVYRNWRKKPENQVLLNMAVANCLFMGLLLWQCLTPQPAMPLRCTDQLPPGNMCRAMGAILHYVVVANFSWMLVAAVTHVLRICRAPIGPKSVPYFIPKVMVAGWSVPLAPVGGLLAIDPSGYNYLPGGREFCYPTGKAFYFAVLAPVAIILFLNVLAYIRIVMILFPSCFPCFTKNTTILRQVGGGSNRHLRSAIIMWAFMFTFGLTWVLGLTAYGVTMMYLQCLAAFFQGPTLFITFVLGEQNLRFKIRRFARTIIGSKDSQRPILYHSSSLSSQEPSSQVENPAGSSIQRSRQGWQKSNETNM